MEQRIDFVTSESADARALRRAIDRGTAMLFRTQKPQPGGAPDEKRWDAPCDLGPSATAQVLVALAHAGELSADERRDGARWLRARQMSDGGFAAYPNAKESHVGATASVWAALELCAPGESRDAIVRAESFIAQKGGAKRVVDEMKTGDVGALFLALAGKLDAKLLPNPLVVWSLIPPVVDWIDSHVSPALPFLAVQVSAIVRRLRGDFGPNGDRRSFLERLECRRCVAVLEEFQNTDGSWNANTPQTAMAVLALWACGVGNDDALHKRACAWLKTQSHHDHDGLWFQSFGSAVWSTALDIGALVACGTPPSDARIRSGLRWLLGSQCRRPQPVTNNRKRNAILTGGWAFQRGNDLFADCDDTGVVLATFGTVLSAKGADAVPPGESDALANAAKRAVAWIENMQNEDGGWSAFVWGLPGKPPGAAMTRPLSIDFDNPLAMLSLLRNPPLALGDPSAEDLTARVLCGLGGIGRDTHDPMVIRALEFLRTMQCDDGSFWGRWTCNYVAATAWVVLGAMAVKADPDEAWLKNALNWLLSKQNTDGSWGETPLSYRDPARKGIGPSMPPLTGIVVQALVAAGKTRDDSVTRAVNYLVRSQRADGTWPANGYLAPNIPPDTFYAYGETERHNPLRALGEYRNALAHPHIAPVDPSDAKWSDAVMDTARQRTDETADKVIDALLAEGQIKHASELFQTLLKSDDPIPAGLPPIAKKYFADTEALPSWADKKQLDLSAELFARTGWTIAAALFCSSLPQAYAAANGALALAQTTRMRTENIEQRIFETAQFLFDVCDRGAFGPNGRGVRAAQKVRLMHAGVRRLILDNPNVKWDAAAHGKPINFEDQAGTLMTFSVVTLDALDTLGVPYSREEGEAWLHTWRVTGHLLGLPDDMMPLNLAEGRALMDAIRRRQWARSEMGRVLTKTLIGLMRSFDGKTTHALDDMPVALIRYLIGDYCADLLDVPTPNWNRFLFEAGLEVTRHFDPFAGHTVPDEIIQAVAFALMRFVVQKTRGFKDAPFRIPSSLTST